MNPVQAGAVAAAAASLVDTHDIAGTLSDMLDRVLAALGAQRCGIQVADREGRLELLAASSHDADSLTLYEAQMVSGPCMDAWSTGVAVSGESRIDVEFRWPNMSEAMEAADQGSLLAVPLKWIGEPLGTLTVFRHREGSFTTAEQQLTQTFADLSMLVIVHTDQIAVRTAAERVDAALRSRILVEQAKGVIAYPRGLSMAEAYEVLKRRAVEKDESLTATASAIVEAASGGPQKSDPE